MKQVDVVLAKGSNVLGAEKCLLTFHHVSSFGMARGESSLRQQNPRARSLLQTRYFPSGPVRSRTVIDASMSPPALSPSAGAGAGSGGSGPLSEERAKPSSPSRQAGKFCSPELLVAPTRVQMRVLI